jgi:hypothetical protein
MRLGDNNFFNLFQQLAAATNANRDCAEWNVAGVNWRRQRHVTSGAVSYQLEVHELRRTAGPKWSLLFVHELWWGGDRRKAIRNVHWTHLQSGNRRDVLRWFQQRQDELEGA